MAKIPAVYLASTGNNVGALLTLKIAMPLLVEQLISHYRRRGCKTPNSGESRPMVKPIR